MTHTKIELDMCILLDELEQSCDRGLYRKALNWCNFIDFPASANILCLLQGNHVTSKI